MLAPQRVSPDQGDGVAPGALSRALLASVFVIAACGLVYELVAGAAASYLLGDSVTQFSLVIGTYLAAMGVGSYLSRYILSGLVARFFEIELAIALLGGLSATAMFIAFAHLGESFRWVLFGFVVVIGVLVGLEIPLVMRILRDRLGFRELVAQVLSFDYLGALAVSLAFPLVLVPRLGLIRTALPVRPDERARRPRGRCGCSARSCGRSPGARRRSRLSSRCSARASPARTASPRSRRRSSTPTASCTRRRRATSASW